MAYKVRLRLKPTCPMKTARLCVLTKRLEALMGPVSCRPDPELGPGDATEYEIDVPNCSGGTIERIRALIDSAVDASEVEEIEVTQIHPTGETCQGTSQAESSSPPTHTQSEAEEDTNVAVEVGEGGETGEREHVVQNVTETRADITQQGDATPGQREGKTEHQFLRVSLEQIEALNNLVGELVTRKSRLETMVDGLIKSSKLCGKDASEFRKACYALDSSVAAVREKAMSLRMVPFEYSVPRLKRTVYEVSSALGKMIRLEVAGETTMVDKTIMDQMAEVFTHLLRNAADHGIEYPEERVANGKPNTGTVFVSADSDGREITFVVGDDGRGLDYEKIWRKAFAIGLVSTQSVPQHEQEIINLLFHPGFSTVDRVSDVSGRGVGLDVVNSCVEDLGGSVRVESRPNGGTRFTMRIPLNLSVVEVLWVDTNEDSWGLPLDSIWKVLRARDIKIVTLIGEPSADIEEKTLPVVCLTGEASGGRDDRIGLVVGNSEPEAIVMVDKIHGQCEVVKKPLPRLVKGLRGLGGAGLTGDGDVLPILDVQELLESA